MRSKRLKKSLTGPTLLEISGNGLIGVIGIKRSTRDRQSVYACLVSEIMGNFLYCDQFVYDYYPKSQENQKPYRGSAKSAGNFLATMKQLRSDPKRQQSAV